MKTPSQFIFLFKHHLNISTDEADDITMTSLLALFSMSHMRTTSTHLESVMPFCDGTQNHEFMISILRDFTSYDDNKKISKRLNFFI